MQIILNDYQWDFLTSEARFPGLVSGWATGKTLCLIQRVMKLAQIYQDNLILVVRKVYKDLADSTIKDFELYTGLKVPSTTRDVQIPGSGSKIMFRHLEELTSGPTKTLIQNVNLGAFAMEQAEEFDTSEQFEMLRGRLRRRLALFEPYLQSFSQREAYFAVSEVCVHCKSPDIAEKDEARSEFSRFKRLSTGLDDPNIETMPDFAYCRSCNGIWPRTTDPRMARFHDFLQHNELRTGFVIANANGKNWVWRQWLDPRRPNADEFVGWGVPTFANEHNLAKDYVRDLRSMEYGTETQQRKYRRFVLNSHEERDIESCYYGVLMQEARQEGRIGISAQFQPDRSLATHTAWDLGASKSGSDSTSIWWFQVYGREYKFIHYYENYNEGIEHYIRYLEDVRKRLNLHYGKHFWPYDGKKFILATGKELRQTAKEMGMVPTNLKVETKKIDGIERVRKILPVCYFHETECAVGIEALESYQKKINQALSTDEHTVYTGDPLHNWASHGADAFRYFTKAIRKLGGTMTAQEVQELQEMYS